MNEENIDAGIWQIDHGPYLSDERIAFLADSFSSWDLVQGDPTSAEVRAMAYEIRERRERARKDTPAAPEEKR